MGSGSEFGVVLVRANASVCWGIRLAGGSDLNSPLIIIRVIKNSIPLFYYEMIDSKPISSDIYRKYRLTALQQQQQVVKVIKRD